MNFAVTGMTSAPQPQAGSISATVNPATDFAVAMDVALAANAPAAVTTTTGTVERAQSAIPSQANASPLFTAGGGIAFGPSPTMMASAAAFLPAIMSMAGLTGRPSAGPANAASYYPMTTGFGAAAVSPTAGASTAAAVTTPALPAAPSAPTPDIAGPAAAIIARRPLAPVTASDMAIIPPTAMGVAETATPVLPVAMSGETPLRPAVENTPTAVSSLLTILPYDTTPGNPIVTITKAMAAPVMPDAIARRLPAQGVNAAIGGALSPPALYGGTSFRGTDVATSVPIPSPIVAAGVPGTQLALDTAQIPSTSVPSNDTSQAMGERPAAGAFAASTSQSPFVAPSNSADSPPTSDAVAVRPAPQSSHALPAVMADRPAIGRDAAATGQAGPMAAPSLVNPTVTGETSPAGAGPLPSLAAAPLANRGGNTPETTAAAVAVRPSAPSTPLYRAPKVASGAITAPPVAGVGTAAAPSPLLVPEGHVTVAPLPAAIAKASPSDVLPMSDAANPSPGESHAPEARPDARPGRDSLPVSTPASPSLSSTPAQATPPPMAASDPVARETIPPAAAADARPRATTESLPDVSAGDRRAPSPRPSSSHTTPAAVPPKLDDRAADHGALPTVLSVQVLPEPAPTTSGGRPARTAGDLATVIPAHADKQDVADVADTADVADVADVALLPTQAAPPPQPVQAATQTLAPARNVPLADPIPDAPQRTAASVMASDRDGIQRRPSASAPVKRAKANPPAAPSLPPQPADAMSAPAVPPAIVAADNQLPQAMAVVTHLDTPVTAPSDVAATVNAAPSIVPRGAPHIIATAHREPVPLESSASPILSAGADIRAAASATPALQSAPSPAAETPALPAAVHAPKPVAGDGLAPQDGLSVPAGVAPATPLDASPRPVAALHRPSDSPVVTAQPGQIGHEVGVAIARRISAGGEELVVRLDPAELGRIEVHMSFDDRGSLRAIIAADSPVALDMLRRDSADLTRSLSDAGIRSDGQSLRFQNDTGGNGSQSRSPWLAADPKSPRQAPGNFGDESEASPYRPVRTSGRYDLLA